MAEPIYPPGDARTVKPGEPVTYHQPEIVDAELPEWLRSIREDRGVVLLEVQPKPNSTSTIELPLTSTDLDQVIEALTMFQRS